MTTEEIIENNKLIAEFLGESKKSFDEIVYCGSVTGTYFRAENLLFHKSWDWLMPVGRKILDVLKELHKVTPKHSACKGDLIEVDIHCAVCTYDIEKACLHMVTFIKWYNENGNKQNTL